MPNRHWAIAFGGSAALGAAASAGVIYEDVTYWMPDGTCVINPSDPPEEAFVKVQETVFDDSSGRAVLATQIGFGLVNGPAIPGVPIEVYAYSITNLNYGNGPFSGAGLGISGFNIFAGVPLLGQWAPNFANSRWESDAPYSWEIDADADTLNGDGIGILLGQTHNSMYFAVPAGTPHGFVDAAIHTWTGEEAAGLATDYIFGCTSGPVPAPAGLALLGLGGLAAARRRR